MLTLIGQVTHPGSNQPLHLTPVGEIRDPLISMYPCNVLVVSINKQFYQKMFAVLLFIK